MPRPKRRFLQMKIPMAASPKQQCCVVCYSDFTPFTTTSDKWDSNMVKMFYNDLDIPSMDSTGEDGDEDDSVISLPFCPQCYSKISVMSSLRTQLQQVQAQFCTIRNDIAFTIVDTIDKNCRNGPMDFIRQQIYDKWKIKFEDAKQKGDLDSPQGLERLASDVPVGNIVLDGLQHCDPPALAFNERPRNDRHIQLQLPSVKHSATNGDLDQPTNAPQETKPQLQQPSKRPARAASHGFNQYLLYGQTTSMAKFKKMEAIAIRESINNEMPKLTPMDEIQGTIVPQKHGYPPKGKVGVGPSIKGRMMSQKVNPERALGVAPKIHKSRLMANAPTSTANNIDVLSVKRRGSTGKRPISIDMDVAPLPVATKFPKVQTTKSILKGIKNEEPLKIKLKAGRKPRYQQDIPDPSISSTSVEEIGSIQNVNYTSVIDLGANGEIPTKIKQTRKGIRSRNSDTLELSLLEGGGVGDFPCKLCPKIYFNISRLRRHESLCHPSTKSLQCSICPNGFSSMLAYRRHMQNQHHRSLKGVVTKTCPFCKKSFVKQTAYDYHVRKHHDRKTKRGRRQRGQELDAVLLLEEYDIDAMDVDPLLIPIDEIQPVSDLKETEPGTVAAAEVSEPQAMIEPVIPIIKKVKRANKIFMGGRKSRKRRAAGIAARKKRVEGVLQTGSLQGPGNSEENGSMKRTSLNVKDGSTSEMTVKPLPKNRRRVFKSRLAEPTPPVRKSLRRAEPVTVNTQLNVADISNSFSDDKIVYNCALCTMVFPSTDLLNIHMLSHTEGDTCTECNEKFGSQEELKSHMSTVHPPSEKLPSSNAQELNSIEPNLEVEDQELVLPNPEAIKCNPKVSVPEKTSNIDPSQIDVISQLPAPTTVESKLSETIPSKPIPPNKSPSPSKDSKPERDITSLGSMEFSPEESLISNLDTDSEISTVQSPPVVASSNGISPALADAPESTLTPNSNTTLHAEQTVCYATVVEEIDKVSATDS